jgi:hypothetical protein
MLDISIKAPAYCHRVELEQRVEREVRVFRNSPETVDIQVRSPEGMRANGKRDMIAGAALDAAGVRSLIDALRAGLVQVEPQACSMAERFVTYYAAWQEAGAGADDGSENFWTWIRAQYPNDDLACVSNWDARERDVPRDWDVTSYAVIDFDDGSIAIRRNVGERRAWMVAR